MVHPSDIHFGTSGSKVRIILVYTYYRKYQNSRLHLTILSKYMGQKGNEENESIENSRPNNL